MQSSTRLRLTSERLELQTTLQGNTTTVFVDFVNGPMGYRRTHDPGRQQPLGRAVGLKPKATLTVVDVTAGLGRDAFVLAWLGCQVHMLERSPLIAALLHDGLQRAYQHPVIGHWVKQRLHFISADALQWLKTTTQYPDVIYLDPMYPPRPKSALVKKEMQVLQTLVGEDSDAPDLLRMALTCARHRVVVKRPQFASALGNLAPTFCIESKTTRFDVYLCSQRK